MYKQLIALAMLVGFMASGASRAQISAKSSAKTGVPAAGRMVVDPPIVYAARKGDNLYTLALRYMHRLSDYRIVQALNHIRNPRRIPIGTNLLIPRPLLRSDPLQAKVVAFRGAATLDGRAALLGAVVDEGGHIRTGPNAFLSLRLADGSTITLPSQTSIRVERLRRFRLTGEMERLFHVDDGRTETQVVPRTNGRDRFEMRTPISVAAVRGTDFRVAVIDGGKAATAEVLGGHVDLAGGGVDTMLDPGVGARVAPEGTTGPVELLPPPDIADPAKVQSELELSFGILPLDKAARYRVQIARDAGFLDIVEEAMADGAQASLPPIPNGDYFVRLTGLDANQIEGLPHVISFRRYLNAIRATVEPLGGRRYLFKWRDLGEGLHQYRFFMMRAAAPHSPVIDEPGLTDKSFVATDLPPGDYIWRVQTSSASDGTTYSNWSSEQALTVAGEAEPGKKRAKPPAS